MVVPLSHMGSVGAKKHPLQLRYALLILPPSLCIFTFFPHKLINRLRKTGGWSVRGVVQSEQVLLSGVRVTLELDPLVLVWLCQSPGMYPVLSAKRLTTGSPEKSKPWSAALTGFCSVSHPTVRRSAQRTLPSSGDRDQLPLAHSGTGQSPILSSRGHRWRQALPREALGRIQDKTWSSSQHCVERCGRLSLNVTIPSWDPVGWHPNALCLDFIILNVIKHSPATFTGLL